jgi:hypothetical protein
MDDISLIVKVSGHPDVSLSLPGSSKVADIKQKLQDASSIFIRHQVHMSSNAC